MDTALSRTHARVYNGLRAIVKQNRTCGGLLRCFGPFGLSSVWRWHTSWCPGWNGYMKSLPTEERVKLAKKYGMDKYR